MKLLTLLDQTDAAQMLIVKVLELVHHTVGVKVLPTAFHFLMDPLVKKKLLESTTLELLTLSYPMLNPDLFLDAHGAFFQQGVLELSSMIAMVVMLTLLAE